MFIKPFLEAKKKIQYKKSVESRNTSMYSIHAYYGPF